MAKWKLQLSTTEPNNDVGLIKINQDDENSQTFEAEISEFGLLKDFSDREVYFNAKIGPYKVRDKVPPETIYYDSNRVAYTLIAPFLQKVGEFEAWFSFKKADDELDEFSTAFFSYRIVPGVTKDIKEGNYFWDLEELLRYFKQHKHLIAEVVENKDFSGLIDQLVQINYRTSNLDNFSTASKTEAEQGVAPNKLMTPERVKQQTDARVSTTAMAIEGLDDKTLMTPAKTKAAIDKVKIDHITKIFSTQDMQNVKVGNIELTRMDDRVFVNGNYTTLDSATSANNASIFIFNLPDGFKNISEVSLSHHIPAKFSTGWARAASNGAIQLEVGIDGARSHSFSGTWLTKDDFPR
ncbi:BppU family phage baseplate upper protein [Enterococcus devriesei]|uniref:BppU family phage baseplate upper protein n=1 Tax=Enterococcus devriesei TaxID=319970 RepID=UPI0028E7E427|nr:BppU family phage baseplate upper protein [Enterococcus devriesei]